jgi:hypothetical protein
VFPLLKKTDSDSFAEDAKDLGLLTIERMLARALVATVSMDVEYHAKFLVLSLWAMIAMSGEVTVPPPLVSI